MDKQTAIDLLDNLLGMVEDNHGSDYDKAIHMGIDALKTQDMSGNMSGTQKELKCTETHSCDSERTETHDWIPVSEALPEPNEVGDDGFVKAYLVQAGRTIHTARYDGEYWVLWTYSRVLDNVVAWMPLPEPWREGQDGTT